MFEPIFRELEGAIPGLLAIAVVAEDGIEIESMVNGDFPHEVMSAEFNGVLRHLNRFQVEYDLGPMQELVIRSEKQNIFLTSLPSGLFMLVVTSPSESTGRARYEIQRRAHRCMELLA